nr:unnamed protein product [Callosobruchus analis]
MSSEYAREALRMPNTSEAGERGGSGWKNIRA